LPPVAFKFDGGTLFVVTAPQPQLRFPGKAGSGRRTTNSCSACCANAGDGDGSDIRLLKDSVQRASLWLNRSCTDET